MGYVAPERGLGSFTCPHCGVLSQQRPYSSGAAFNQGNAYDTHDLIASSLCTHCNKYSIWVRETMVFPNHGTAPLPNPDMPADVLADYEEAARVATGSPKAAAALLRLAIQKLCVHLGGQGKNINADIASLVKNGLPSLIQRSLDIVRVVGNNAVHPGQIDVDDPEVVGSLFELVNLIVETMISTPNKVSGLYQTLPGSALEGIAQRDGDAAQ